MATARFELNIRARGFTRSATLDDKLRRAFSGFSGPGVGGGRLTAIDLTVFTHGRRFGLEIVVHAAGKHTLTLMREGVLLADAAAFDELTQEAVARVAAMLQAPPGA
jgi:hypothetical protein